MRIAWIRSFPLVLLTLSMGCAEMSGIGLGDFFSFGSAPRTLDEGTVARGLQQALDVGAERTTRQLSAPGGFGDASRLRIGLPDDLDMLAAALRGVGLGTYVDDLEDSMNLAAEQASGHALPILRSAIVSMTITDAFAILNGPDDAATRYFKSHTSASLEREFKPVVSSAMKDVGLYRTYRDLLARYDAIPFSRLPDLDLEAYVARETMAAIFDELEREEARIRADPAARSTALLRRVFGSVAPDGPGE